MLFLHQISQCPQLCGVVRLPAFYQLKTGRPRDGVTCPRSGSWEVVELGFKPWSGYKACVGPSYRMSGSVWEREDVGCLCAIHGQTAQRHPGGRVGNVESRAGVAKHPCTPRPSWASAFGLLVCQHLFLLQNSAGEGCAKVDER